MGVMKFFSRSINPVISMVSVAMVVSILTISGRFHRVISSPNSQKPIVPMGMILIPAGEFIIGTNDSDADEDLKPARTIYLPAFAIDKTEVTNAEFKKFRPAFVFSPGEDQLPATNILYDDAEAYAHWAGKRIPTEEEWEKAARGTDGRKYPWGNEWKPELVAARRKTDHSKVSAIPASIPNGNYCAVVAARVQPVGKIPGGASPYGCLDMAGNAWEWVQGHPNGRTDQRILRGGAVGYKERSFRTYIRGIEGSGST